MTAYYQILVTVAIIRALGVMIRQETDVIVLIHVDVAHIFAVFLIIAAVGTGVAAV